VAPAYSLEQQNVGRAHAGLCHGSNRVWSGINGSYFTADNRDQQPSQTRLHLHLRVAGKSQAGGVNIMVPKVFGEGRREMLLPETRDCLTAGLSKTMTWRRGLETIALISVSSCLTSWHLSAAISLLSCWRNLQTIQTQLLPIRLVPFSCRSERSWRSKNL